MLRQIANLRRYGRLRTNAPTPRPRKPRFLKENPDLELSNLLELVIARYGKPDEDFFFVEIGAFDGVTADPIYHMVCDRGWRGVLVEPQLEAFKLLQENYADRPGLQFFNGVVSDHDGEITLFTRHCGMVQAASIQRQLMMKPGKRRRQVEARTVPSWTLETLLRKANAPATIDLLQMDCEGFDFEIIRSIDFSRVKPVIIRYEHMVLSESDRNACLELLASQGYRFVLEDSDTTAYCEDAAHRALRACRSSRAA